MGIPRKKFVRFECDGAARFLTFSCYRHLPLFKNEQIKSRFVERMTIAARDHAIDIFAWVVMPEHAHLVVLPNQELGITTFLKALKSPFAAEVLTRWRSLDAPILEHLRNDAGDTYFWQPGGGHDRIVIAELGEKIRYCHRNPSVRGLCVASADWLWSSARAYEGREDYAGPPIAFDKLPRLKPPLT